MFLWKNLVLNRYMVVNISSTTHSQRLYWGRKFKKLHTGRIGH